LVIGLTPKKKKRPVFNVTEQTTPRVQATITAEDGRTPLPGSVLSTLTLTLYADDGDETIINSRNQQNVLQTNGVTVDEFGTLLWVLQSADLAILDSLLPYERHIALIEWTWPTDKAGKAECVFVVRRVVS
jgi:hypothetical protein